MVKHTQKIRRQIANELFECVWPFCEIGAKRVQNLYNYRFRSFSAIVITFYYHTVQFSSRKMLKRFRSSVRFCEIILIENIDLL